MRRFYKEYPAYMYEKNPRTAEFRYEGEIPEWIWDGFKKMVWWAIDKAIELKINPFDDEAYMTLWKMINGEWSALFYGEKDGKFAENWSHQVCKVAMRELAENLGKRPAVLEDYFMISQRLYNFDGWTLRITTSKGSHVYLNLTPANEKAKEFLRYFRKDWAKPNEIIVRPGLIKVYYKVLKPEFRPKTIFDILG